MFTSIEDRRCSVNYYWGLPHKMNFERVTGYQIIYKNS